MYQDKPSPKELYDELYHYGIKRRSGRYPWGSGDDPYQHSGDFLSRVNELKKEGMTESEIAKAMGFVNSDGKPSSTQLRAFVSIANDERKSLLYDKAKSMREDGKTYQAIADELGLKNESSARSVLNEDSAARRSQARKTADIIKAKIDKEGPVDVGKGVEVQLGISKEKLDQALYILEAEGYPTYGGRVDQVTNPGKKTTVRVAFPPGAQAKDVYNLDKIASVTDVVSHDGGETFQPKFHYPSSLDSKRLMIRYKEDGGELKDGVVELRRGVEDLSLGEKRYSQVRILVDDSKYIKGMAVYSDDMPPGVDVIFNTNKSKSVSKLDVLKDVKRDSDGNIDRDNPFGSAIKDADQGGQYWYTDSKTGQKKLGLINKRADEGDWSEWKDKVPSQFLSKQPTSLAKRQLGLAIDDKIAELNEINSLTNPTIKKKLLKSFSDDCDSAAVHLYGAALPRQKYHVILPVNSLKDNEVYAPNYRDGEQVALIRYPHGGTFEIPILTVNNKNKAARNLIGPDATDAVGITKKNADRLSGADFDGDTVMVIPTNDKVKIKSTKPLAGLEGFDPKMSYGTVKKKNPDYTGKKGEEEYFYYNSRGNRIKVMNNTQNEMGRISNLITDMTIKGADTDELARAVRHSMVVIDAEKHKLDYKQSEIDNGIKELKQKYQEGGASTLLSRAKSQSSIPKTQGSPRVNVKGSKDYDPSRPEGALIYRPADDLYYPVRSYSKTTGLTTITTSSGKKITYDRKNAAERDKYDPIETTDPKTGKVVFKSKDGSITYRTSMRKQQSTKMADTDDAMTLVSNKRTPMELIYADYANRLKSLANQARKEMMTTGNVEYNRTAAKTYKKEVDSLTEKLNKSKMNAPKERQAQVLAGSVIRAKQAANPDMTKDELKKLKDREIKKARLTVGAERVTVDITDREWEAIQAGAISESKLSQILNHTDTDAIRKRATPKATVELSPSKQARIKAMLANGLTTSQIAGKLGVSTSTVNKYAK